MQHNSDSSLDNGQSLWKPSSNQCQNHVDNPLSKDVAASTVIELNVGGVVYATTRATLISEPNSLLFDIFSQRRYLSTISHAKENFFQNKSPSPGAESKTSQSQIASEPHAISLSRDFRGRLFIDRDGVLFRFVLDYLRNGKLVLPDCFLEANRLRQEAEFYRLPGIVTQLNSTSPATPPSIPCNSIAAESHQSLTTLPIQSQHSSLSSGHLDPEISGRQRMSSIPSKDSGFIVVGYRGTFAFGRDGCQADVKFRKMWRILVCGRVALCREVFKDTLNESRDADRGTTDRYTSRFFLKHTFLEQAFDMLQEAGFRMVASCGSGTNSAGGELKPGMDLEESKWNHYNEFVFCRE